MQYLVCSYQFSIRRRAPPADDAVVGCHHDALVAEQKILKKYLNTEATMKELKSNNTLDDKQKLLQNLTGCTGSAFSI